MGALAVNWSNLISMLPIQWIGQSLASAKSQVFLG